jgi:LacI family transcriptional regulator, gluconate utilization system Gnt-I transcriptional repressor
LKTKPSTSQTTRRITLDDIAREAGVSRITASRALRGVGGVSANVSVSIRETAAKLGYTPDVAARTLASSRSTHVIVLVPMLSNTLFVDLLEAVHGTLFAAGFHPMIGVTHYDQRQEEDLLRSYLGHRPAGLLVTGLDRSERAKQLIEGSGVPCVHMMEVSHDLHCVGFSQEDAGSAMTDHLLARGRKKIAFIAAQLDPRTLRRAEGYRRSLRRAGLYDRTLELLSPEPSSVAIGSSLLLRLLAVRPDVDAVFFCNDDLALGGLAAARNMGLPVPGRLSIAGFNDLPGTDFAQPPLTTVRTPRSQIGMEAAKMLLCLLRGEPTTTNVQLPFNLVVRAST